MPRKLRISHVIVQPVLVWDDGEELAPGPPLQPQQVPASALAGVAAGLAEQVGELQASLDQAEAAPAGEQA